MTDASQGKGSTGGTCHLGMSSCRSVAQGEGGVFFLGAKRFATVPQPRTFFVKIREGGLKRRWDDHANLYGNTN